jgi:gp178
MKLDDYINKLERLSILVDSVSIISLIDNLKEIKESQKVTVPQFVADWYEERKDDLDTALFRCVDIIPRVYEDGELNQFQEWFVSDENKSFQTLVNMHQFGYEVEKEKRYSVKIKGKIEENLLVYGLGINRYFFARTYDSSKRNEHTRKELEEAGFGWVFDCEGMEVKEV